MNIQTTQNAPRRRRRRQQQRPMRKARTQAPRRTNVFNDVAMGKRVIPATGLEPSYGFVKKNVGSYYRKMIDPGVECPALAFAMGCMNPSYINTPFVQEGDVRDTKTQVVCGKSRYTAVAPAPPVTTDNYLMVTLCVAADRYNAGSSLGFYQTTTPGVAVNLINIIGTVTKVDLYGVQTYADRMVPFASEANIELIAPALYLQGVVYLGSAPISSLNGGATITQLINRARYTYDVKSEEGRNVVIRNAICNTGIVHFDGSAIAQTTDGIEEEMITYAIYQSPVASGAGTVSSCTVNVSVTTQSIWAPDGSQPALSGLDLVKPTASAMSNDPISMANASILRRMNDSPIVPPNWSLILRTCMNRRPIASLVSEFLNNGSMGLAVSTGRVMRLSEIPDPCHLFTAVRTYHDANSAESYLQWESVNEPKWFNTDAWPATLSELYDEYCTARSDLITQLTSFSRFSKQFLERANQAERVSTYNRGIPTTVYREGDLTIDWYDSLKTWEDAVVLNDEDHDDAEEAQAHVEPHLREFAMPDDDDNISRMSSVQNPVDGGSAKVTFGPGALIPQTKMTKVKTARLLAASKPA